MTSSPARSRSGTQRGFLCTGLDWRGKPNVWLKTTRQLMTQAIAIALAAVDIAVGNGGATLWVQCGGADRDVNGADDQPSISQRLPHHPRCWRVLMCRDQFQSSLRSIGAALTRRCCIEGPGGVGAPSTGYTLRNKTGTLGHRCIPPRMLIANAAERQ